MRVSDATVEHCVTLYCDRGGSQLGSTITCVKTIVLRIQIVYEELLSVAILLHGVLLPTLKDHASFSPLDGKPWLGELTAQHYTVTLHCFLVLQLFLEIGGSF